jgi:Ca-activated chloride channel family protein
MKTDDPKFTAYCLGELDPVERAEIEALRDADPEIAAEIEETKAFATQLRAELVHESHEGGLDETRRANVLRAAEKCRQENLLAQTSVSTSAAGSRWGTWMLRMAALFALLALVAGVFFSDRAKDHRRFTANNLAIEDRIHPTDGTADLPDMSLAYPDAPVQFGENAEKLAKAIGESDFAKNGLAILPQLNEATVPREEKPMLLAQLDAQKTDTDLGRLRDDYFAKGPQPDGAVQTRPSADQPSDELAKVSRAPRPAIDWKEKPVARETAAVSGTTNWAAPTAPAAPAAAALANSSLGLAGNTPLGTVPAETRRRAVKLEAEVKELQDPSTLSVITDNETMLRQKTARGAESTWGGRGSNEARSSTGRLASSADEARKQLEALDSGAKDVNRLYDKQRERFYRFDTHRYVIQTDPSNTEAYDAVTDNAFMDVRGNPVSTFSIDVDSASYANVRRFLNAGQRPPKGAVRIEELLNYFTYDYPQPNGEQAFSATLEAGPCPWKPEHRLVRVGLKGREIKRDQRPATNLVFLVDVSGSMQPANKLPLVKESLRLLVDQLSGEDRVSIAVYAGASGCVLEPTSDKALVRAALDKLEAGGSTNGASGIQLAYDLAQKAFIQGGVNRVILATDGDFNVGITSQSALIDLIESKAKSGVFLSVLGFGMGNLKDSTLEKLADKGNGNYAYIDTLNEGRKVLVEQMSGTLVTIAKDVKIQVEFNPAQVTAYRLIGYENRLLAKEDFNDDTKDAGEIGAGHSVTALYEVVPAGQQPPNRAVDPLKYQNPAPAPAQIAAVNPLSREMLTLKLRHKLPDGDKSQLLELPLVDEGAAREKTSRDFRFAAAVASFGMLLRESPYKGSANWDTTMELAVEGKGEDSSGYRGEFISLIGKAKALDQIRSGNVPVVAPPASPSR